ncbi:MULTISPECIES: PIG-L family deacetylase [unclassified Streptomyces]|uniref:PIG-L family deacetylase n=1 Tax=unclassified Streptomyces TaxID=2593676 RepID=UPI0023660BD4|nr:MULTISPECIES: PIG-L family deacetylase [unclassified Streptomyces]MDF3141639.1 PIG-L family deacetylase [Streptomyces sp. T21Q-yed]WDF39348.1 PIG-L family deacetylase [Streptomyces sp. T12]
MPQPSLLAVFAHPDDESLSSGGVLARHAAAGARTAVVTATWTPDTGRGAELAEALRILGAGEPRMLDAPLDEAVGRLVAHIRQFRPQIVVTHDAYGGVTGHPDHVHTHRVTTLAFQASGLERLYPDAGSPWQPSSLYLATHPHSALGAPVLAHRSEVERGAAPGLLAGFARDVRERFLSTEWYIRQDAVPSVSAQTELTP